jgi:outer membrane receptor protein involved in Fe transport
MAVDASAQTLPGGPAARGKPNPTVSEVVVTASRRDLLGRAAAASQGSITPEELRLRPAYRVAQILESVPGLVVTVHSGEGKAYQYLLRGFNLDHGTDIANFIDGMPINRPTNAHGQGYSDQNFVLPQLLGGLDFTKGPYDPSIGDFGAVASVKLGLADAIPNQVEVSAGTLNDDAVFLGGTHNFSANDRVLAAVDYGHVDGPFTHPDNFQKYAAALRYSHGDASDGESLTALYYHGASAFTTDQPLRAVQEGLIGRYGTLDPSDGTQNERISLSGVFADHGEAWRVNANAYFVHSRQTLWNDFTHFLEDPVNGDQEQQDETRDVGGGGASVTLSQAIGAIQTETTFGVQGRYDSVHVDRRHTRLRQVLDYCEQAQLFGPAVPYAIGERACSADQVQLGDEAIYADSTIRFNAWLRADLGAREEFYQGQDHSLISGFDGAQAVTLFQPKGGLVLGPWWKTELYVSAGRGFHSDDLRGVLQTVPIEGIPRAAGPTPLLVRADGEEIGLRSDLIPDVHVQASVFNIDLQSELIYDQDQGQDQASAPSERQGVEVSAQYRPRPWLELNTDLSLSHARFTASNLAAYGFSGDHIPNAPGFVGSFGALVDHLGPWFGGLEVRSLGAYALVSDNAARDAGYTETNLEVGYRIDDGLKLRMDIFNLFDVRANAAAYFYTSRLAGEPAQGVADHQDHPLEPISARFTITATF